MSSKLVMFMETTSLRGFGKIVRSQTLFLRYLWLSFVLVTTCLLTYSVYNIVQEYLLYDVNIQTKLEIDDPTPFPAISFCNNQPFSPTAYELWRNKTILSPTEFNSRLREKALKALLKRSPDDYKRLADLTYRFARQKTLPNDSMEELNQFREENLEALRFSLVNDNSRMYYQNLDVEQAYQLGHTRNETIVDCVFKKGLSHALGTRGCQDDFVKFSNFSHPNYFNCMTLEFTPDKASAMDSMAIIFWLGPDENYDIQFRQGFLFDVFEQAYGIRVMIHEPGSAPNILENGIQIEPGKMNEMQFQPVKFRKANTPMNPCITESDAKKLTFKDLKNEYSYDLGLCLSSKLQHVYREKCGCLYVELPRINLPNKTIPYCGFLDSKLPQRADCASKIDERHEKKIFKKTCLPKCQEVFYEHQLSVTKWRDTQWQLFWMSELGRRWNELLSFQDVKYSKEEMEALRAHVVEYVKAKNITDLSLFKSGPGSFTSFKFDDRYTFLVVKRKSNNTMVKQEKRVLTGNALFSRLGGLGSIYLGLTLAFIVEVIEFLFNVLCVDKQKTSQKPDSVPKVIELAVEMGEQHLLLPYNTQTVISNTSAQNEEDPNDTVSNLDSQIEPVLTVANQRHPRINGSTSDDQIWIKQNNFL